MTLNPLKFAQEVNKQYLRYQLTEHRLTDPALGDQLEQLLWRNDSPLVKGPFVSISRAFEEGRSVRDLIKDKVLHPKMETIIPYESVYKHQEETLRAVEAGKDVLITTGTGSGKTESFLYPILNRILRNRDRQGPKGVTALIVYPMNALATDQLERLRELLVGTGITFGMYTGETPTERADATYSPRDVPAGTSRDAYRKLLEFSKQENFVYHPNEERYTRKSIQEDPPRILLTNTRMLEYLLTRADDLRFLRDAPLEFLVMDEAHTNSGALGAEVALLVRRVKAIVHDKDKIRHLAASATIVDKNNAKLGQRFLARLVGAREDNIQIVWESYQDLKWHDQPLRGQVPRDAEALYERTLKALDLAGPAREKELEAIYLELTNHQLPADGAIEDRLHDGFLRIDFARAIYETGATVGELSDRIQDAWSHVGRGHVRSDEKSKREARWEYLTYLALGAAAVKDDTPILRPKLHFFVKGLEDAVVVFTRPGEGERTYVPELFLSRERALAKYESLEPTAMFTIKSCPRCGQHHYEQYLDLEGLEDKAHLSGGTTIDGGAVFHVDQTGSKTRILFTDRVMQETGDYEDGGTKKHTPGMLCRFCGAIHTGAPTRCGSCEHVNNHELVPVQILDSVNKVTTCPVCGYGAGFNPGQKADPFRALTENTARNVYVLAQDMLSLAEPSGRKLIIFADNRQDAAFQAGSMRDNSRIFRLRQLIQQYVRTEADIAGGADGSLENLVDRLIADIKKDEALARFVAPEVFEQTLEGAASFKRDKELKRFLSIQVLNELSRPYTDRKALEALGQLRIRYVGLQPESDAVQDLAHKHGLKPKDVSLWLECLLHQARRRRSFSHDLVPDLYAQSWDDKRNDLVAMRYVPDSDFRPGGLIVEKEVEHKDSKANLQAFIGKNSAIEGWAKQGLGLIEPERREPFLRDAWALLTDRLKLLRRLRSLKWGNGKPIAGSSNVTHVHGGAMILTQAATRSDCSRCKRLHGHPTPNDACTAYRCAGLLAPVDDDVEPRDYDLVLLSRKRDLDSFVMAEEHTAQVPKGRRQEIERRFKKGQGVNTLVATPTLELGVDIGPLDMVLMRNVPPTAANYWQRSGRAGRRNRMAVIYSYARNNPHDLHYYEHPSKMLGGAIHPPRFNLRNPVMVRKHVHASLLTYYQEKLRTGQADWVKAVFPKRVGEALFAEGKLRSNIDDIVEPFEREAHADPALLPLIRRTFAENWPDDPNAVSDALLQQYVEQAPSLLLGAYRRVWNRLRWAQDQVIAIAARERDGGALGDEEIHFQRRCRSFIGAFNPNNWNKDDPGKRVDASYTLKVLATEGYLPGYATTSDSVTASAHQAYSPGWERFEFELTRNATVAIREHIPGNRIYANGGKYKLTNYLFPADEEVRTPVDWKVHPVTMAVKSAAETTSAQNMAEWTTMQSLPLVDSTLQYMSHVDAQETTRYRISCQVSGVVRESHGGGLQYQFPDQVMEHRRSQDITLVNLGPLSKMEEELGFPICIDCGATRSPHESDSGIQHFIQYHEKLHKRAPGRYALHANATVDGLLFKNCPDAMHAASLAEALRLAASQVLEMERDDLDWFMQAGEDDQVDLFLYDAMPGGSGLLHQMTDNWPELMRTAREILTKCPGACATSCYHCLRTYYNQFWHDQLDRTASLEALALLDKLPVATPLDVRRGQSMVEAEETNKWEKMLQHVLHDDWGFTALEPQGRIELPACRIPYTKPDFVNHPAKVAVYLDGKPHFALEILRRDHVMREELQDMGWVVIEVPIGDMNNETLMARVKERIARKMAKSPLRV